ncbi:MAG: hypothetical protein LRS43_03765 [Desulfurococcales archaeon]|nr:hypothetical protein [Desulfurococcales archaeon]
MKASWPWLLILVALIAGAGLQPLLNNMVEAIAQPSEDEARSAFEQLGCVSCHNGNVAQTRWEDIVADFTEWRDRYASLDEAVASEVEYFGGRKFSSFRELMEVMAQNARVDLSDPQMIVIMEYLVSLYGVTLEEALGGQVTPAPPEETAPEEEETIDVGYNTLTMGGEEPGIGIATTIIVIAVIVLGSGIVAYLMTKR